MPMSIKGSNGAFFNFRSRTRLTWAAARCAVIASLTVTIFVGGCSNGLQGIDRRANELIADRNALLGGNAMNPSYEHLDEVRRAAMDVQYTENMLEVTPDTVNPAASDLVVERADVEDVVVRIMETYAGVAEDAVVFDLRRTLEYATGHSREYLSAKEELLLAALRLLTQRHLFGPRFFNDVSASFTGDAEDGDYDIAARLMNEFRVTQRLQNGGDVSIRALVDATEQLRSTVSSGESQDASIILSANIPLLRGAGPSARESLISAERELIYATRTFERFRQQFLFSVATDYFDLVQAIAQIRNAERVLEGRRKLYDEVNALYRAGRRPQFELSETQQRVLAGENSLAAQRDRYLLQLEQLRIRLGMPPDEPIRIDPDATVDLPVPALDIPESVLRGLTLRLDLQTRRDRVTDSRRSMANARNDLLPDLDLSASMTAITDPDLQRGGLQFDEEEFDYFGSITFGLPLDRETERISLRESSIRLEQARRDLREFEDTIALNIRAAIRDIQLALFSLRAQNESISLIERRIYGLELRRDEVNTRTRIDAADELAAALDQRDAAIRNLRVAILRYLLETGQFRVDVEGQLLTPVGLEPLTPQQADELYEIGRSIVDSELNPPRAIPEDAVISEEPGEPEPVENNNPR